MPKQIFINLPVQDLAKAKDLVTHIGFTINPQFTDDTAACVVVSEEIYFMLLTHDKFKQYSLGEIADTKTTNECIISISCDSRDEVDTIVRKALEKGATTIEEPMDYGFMYQHGFRDLDGHLWGFLHMDMAKFEEMQSQASK